MSSAIPQYRRVWRQFLEMYISMPCLWQVHCPDYGNREKRDECYYKLAEMCRQIEPTANKEFVLKKINCYRTTFRKELKKAQDAQRKGTHYEPTLWYYRILLPVAEQQPNQPVKTEDLSGLDGYDCDPAKTEAGMGVVGTAGALGLGDASFGVDDDGEGGCEKEEDDDEGAGATPECESVLTERFASPTLQDGNPLNASLVHASLQHGLRPKRRRVDFDYVSVSGGGSSRDEDAVAAGIEDGLRWRSPPSPPPPPPQPPSAPPPPPGPGQSSPQRQEDAFDFVGRNVAAKLRALARSTPLQAIVAEKLISDVLFHAQLDSLTCAAKVIASAAGDVTATATAAAEVPKVTREATVAGERETRPS